MKKLSVEQWEKRWELLKCELEQLANFYERLNDKNCLYVMDEVFNVIKEVESQ